MSLIKLSATLLFIAHGFGHVQGLIAHLGFSTVAGHHDRSWLLTPAIGSVPSRIIGFMLYLACMVLWAGAGLALQGWGLPKDWFIILATTAAFVSIIAIAIFWNSLMLPFNRIAALTVNLGVLTAIYLLGWPAE